MDEPNSGANSAKQSRKKRFLKLLISLFIIILFPVLPLHFSGFLYTIPFPFALEGITKFETNPIFIQTYFLEGIELTIELISVVVGIAFLFQVTGISKETKAVLETKRYGRFLLHHLLVTEKEKQTWHFFVGYFLLLLVLTPVLGNYVFEISERDTNIGNSAKFEDNRDPGERKYDDMVRSVPMLTTILIATRVISQLKLKILESNIGIFIIAVLVAESLLVVAAGEMPQMIVYSFGGPGIDLGQAIGAVMLYGLIVIGSVVATIVDYLIIKRLMKWLSIRLHRL